MDKFLFLSRADWDWWRVHARLRGLGMLPLPLTDNIAAANQSSHQSYHGVHRTWR